MISKELFIKRMNLIQDFYTEKDTLSELIEKVIDGYASVKIGDSLINEMIDMLSESLFLDKNNDIISWWLFENVEKIIYDISDEGKDISVETLEELYDYIVTVKEG